MKKKKSYCIFHSLFFLFPTAALMVNGLLFAGHECLMMEEVSLFFVVKGRHCSVQTWPVVNDRLVRFHASEKRVVLVSPPPPSKMFAARRRTGKRRKRGDVRTARRSSASKPLFVFARQRQFRLGNIATLMMLERERMRQFSRRSHTLTARPR